MFVFYTLKGISKFPYLRKFDFSVNFYRKYGRDTQEI